METTNAKSIFLMLGDIIQIISPTNDTFHEKKDIHIHFPEGATPNPSIIIRHSLDITCKA